MTNHNTDNEELRRKLTHIVQGASADDKAITFPEGYVEEIMRLFCPTKSSGELEEILNDTIFDHEDDDHGTCASNFARCNQCSERVYWGNRHYHTKHTAPPQWIEDKCDCHVSKEKAELKAAILAWHTTQTTKLQAKARLDELKSLKKQTTEVTHPSAFISGASVAQSIRVHTNSLIEYRIQHLEREYKIGGDCE